MPVSKLVELLVTLLIKAFSFPYTCLCYANKVNIQIQGNLRKFVCINDEHSTDIHLESYLSDLPYSLNCATPTVFFTSNFSKVFFFFFFKKGEFWTFQYHRNKLNKLSWGAALGREADLWVRFMTALYGFLVHELKHNRAVLGCYTHCSARSMTAQMRPGKISTD